MNEPQKSITTTGEFRIREYDAVLDRMVHARSDVSRVETVYPLAIVAIYAWVFTNPPAIRSLWIAALLLPVGIASLGVVRLYSRRRHMTLLETYVREHEEEVYGDREQLGWERRYAASNPLKGLIVVRAIIALLILGGTLYIASQSNAWFDEWRAATTADS